MTTTPETVPVSGRLVKRIASAVVGIMALPFVLGYRIMSALLPDRRNDVFQGFSQAVSLWPGYVGIYLRKGFYRRTLRHCEPDVHIGFGTLLVTPDIAIGRHVYIGARCMIAHSVIRDDVLIGSNVDIIAGPRTHGFDRLDVPVRLQDRHYDSVTIGRDAWIGNGAIVLADVGDQAIIAAGSVVAKPVDNRWIVAGNPARPIRERVHRDDGDTAAPSTAAAAEPPTQ